MRAPEHLIQSEVLLSFSHLRHGSTMRHFNTRECDRTEEVRRLQRTLDIPQDTPIVHGDQCHTNRVAIIDPAIGLPEDPDKDGRSWILETDGLICAGPGVTLCVYSADCVPLLLFDPVREVIGAVHAGWRGSLARISMKAVETMVGQCGCDPEDLVAWVGPAAGADYEVSHDLAEEFEAAFPEIPAREYGWRKGRHLNLPLLNQLQLAVAGVSLSHVSQSAINTLDPRSQVYSYRRDGGPTGRIITSITLLPAEPARR